MRSNNRGSIKKRRGSPSSEVFLTSDKLPESLHDILECQHLRTEFMIFLRGRLANETLLFYESIELYEQLTKPEHRMRAGRKMVEEFVMPEAIYWVNLPSGIREDLTAVVDFGPDTFTEVKSEVFQLMSSNFFMSFKKHLAGRNDADSPLEMSGVSEGTRSESFAHLAKALGGSFYMTGDSVDSVNCSCPATDNWEDICCEAKKKPS